MKRRTTMHIQPFQPAVKTAKNTSFTGSSIMPGMINTNHQQLRIQHKKTINYYTSLFVVSPEHSDKNSFMKIFIHKSGVASIAFLSFFIVFLLAFNHQTLAQTTIVSEGFNNTLTAFTFTGTGAFYTGSSASGDRPALSPFASEGTHSGGVSNGTLVLTSASNVNTSGFTNIQLSFRLAAFSIGSTSDGVDASDNVVVEISTNGGTSYSTILTLNGAPAETGANNDCNWAYTATAVGTTAYPAAATFIAGNLNGGGTRTTDGYSTLSITSLPATTTLRVRITLDNNQTVERWLIDDFKITGTLAVPTITSFTPSNGCPNTTPVVITGTNFTGATAVKFGGTDALSFTVNLATQITAIPATGTTGTISVTGPTGTGTSVSTFTVNSLPVASVTSQSNISCFNTGDGKIVVAASSGSGTYTFSIHNGIPVSSYQASNTFNSLSPGVYQIRVKDSNGCESKSVQ